MLPDKVQPSYDVRQEKGFLEEMVEEGAGNGPVMRGNFAGSGELNDADGFKDLGVFRTGN